MSFGTFLLWAKCGYPSDPLIPTEICRGDGISMQRSSWSALNNQPRRDSWVTEISPLLFLLQQSLFHKTTQLQLKAQHWVWADFFFCVLCCVSWKVVSKSCFSCSKKETFFQIPAELYSWPACLHCPGCSFIWMCPLQELPVTWAGFFCLSYAFVRQKQWPSQCRVHFSWWYHWHPGPLEIPRMRRFPLVNSME